LCAALGISYAPSMLRWTAGAARPMGLGACVYLSVERSTGFDSPGRGSTSRYRRICRRWPMKHNRITKRCGPTASLNKADRTRRRAHLGNHVRRRFWGTVPRVQPYGKSASSKYFPKF